MDKELEDERLQKNIRIWKQRQPGASSLDFSTVDLSGVSLKKEESGDVNLIFEEDGASTPLYIKNPLRQEQEWMKTLFEAGKPLPQLLIIYGVGLGYSYFTLRKWLEISPNYRIIYLEDDPRILYRFFQTELATQMLGDPRVRLCFFNDSTKAKLYYDLARGYSSMPFKFVGQTYYLQHKSPSLIKMKYDLEHYFHLVAAADQELSSFGKGFFSNYFPNLFEATESQFAAGCYGIFSSIPAIIVGAGPSLEKSIPLLKELENKALIIAGGTAINALNAAGINPHICIGIDPNPSHALRALTSTSFMTPYFFHGRIYHPILKLWHGDHCFINGSSGYPFAELIEKQLGIASKALSEGFNVVNLSLSLAKALGCKAIATVGVDLAYTQEQSYPPLLPSHPLDQPRSGYKTKTSKEDLVLRSDINGEPILSLWKWIHESMWIGQFALENTSLDFVNATEGGLGFPGVANTSLKEFSDKFCQNFWDIKGVVHSAIQMAKRPDELTYSTVYALLEKYRDELGRCISYMEAISGEFSKMQQELSEGKLPPEGYANEALLKNLLNLQQEEVYSRLLYAFDANLQSKFQKLLNELGQSVDLLNKENVHEKTLRIHEMRYELLAKGAKELQTLLKDTLIAKEQERDLLQRCMTEKPIAKIPDSFAYTFTSSSYRIEEPSLGLSYSGKEGSLAVNQEEHLFNSLRIQLNKKNGRLHGPFKVYTADNRLLYESWFIDGQREGFLKGYTNLGNLHFIEGYRKGLPEGERLYFYADGSVKASFLYSEGALEGELKQYHSNGQIKKQISFSKGKKDGKEIICQENGEPIIESNYREGLPVGQQNYYNQQGKVLRSAVYGDDGELQKLFMADKGGNLKEYPLDRAKDYYELVSKKVHEMTQEIAGLLLELNKFASALEEEMGTQLKERQELKDLAKQIISLQELSENFIKASKIGIGAYNEKIWQTPSNEGILNEQLLMLKNHLSACIQVMRKQLSHIVSEQKRK